MKKYFLIAKNRDKNDFKVLNLGKDAAVSKHFNSLEEIDEYTISFNNQEELLAALKRDNIISDADDIFIISERKGTNKLRIRNPLYKQDNADLANMNAAYLRYIKGTDEKQKKADLMEFKKYMVSIYAHFINKVIKVDEKDNPNLYKDMVLFTINNIPEEIKNQINYHKTDNLKVVFQKYLKSYNTARDIIEVSVAFQKYGCHKDYNEKFYNIVNPTRLKSKVELLDLFDSYAVVGQLNMFSEKSKGRN